MSNPQISVVMSVFNSEKYLRESIGSILAQSFNDFEFLIIDDFSTDKSFSIAKEFAQKDHRIIILSNEKKKGIAGAVNTGLEHAKGKYIARFDADDYSFPDKQPPYTPARRCCFKKVFHSGNRPQSGETAVPYCGVCFQRLRV